MPRWVIRGENLFGLRLGRDVSSVVNEFALVAAAPRQAFRG
jgi:hypothetical protein